MMGKRRIVLISQPHLLGEGLAQVLSRMDEVELLGRWGTDEHDLAQLAARIAACSPDLVIIAGEHAPFDHGCAREACLTARLLEILPSLTIIRVSLDQNTLQVYSFHTFPAQSAGLSEIIRKLRTAKDEPEA